ncbi:MAG TPA: AraC family transcriptional regulator [Pricia sp.]|nr:AraC family transcriptional regulator [Pricia sp.]
MDVLSDVLRTVRLTGSIFFTADLYHPWSVSSPTTEMLLHHMPTKAECVSLFHIVTEGESWFKTENSKPFLLRQGSVIIFPHCVSHLMGSTLQQRPVPVIQLLTPDILLGNTNLHHGGSGKKAQFICGYLLCDQRFNPLLGAIPELLIVSSEKERILSQNPGLSVDILSAAPDSWLNATIHHLIHEVVEKNSGSATIITRLTELMFVEVLRKFMSSLPEKSRGWLAGLRDPQVGRALKWMHAHPEEKWDVEQLAAKVGVSRSAFAKRFTDLIGESPMQYLTGWRMQLAKNLLLRPELSMGMVADKVGYDSDIAFNRAFKRQIGIPPARWRETTRSHQIA